jgi:hypothetical protein
MASTGTTVTTVTTVLSLPVDVLWLILRQYLYDVWPVNYLFREYIDKEHGYCVDSEPAAMMVTVASIHTRFQRCLRKYCVWHVTPSPDYGRHVWDFAKYSLGPLLGQAQIREQADSEQK